MKIATPRRGAVLATILFSLAGSLLASPRLRPPSATATGPTAIATAITTAITTATITAIRTVTITAVTTIPTAGITGSFSDWPNGSGSTPSPRPGPRSMAGRGSASGAGSGGPARCGRWSSRSKPPLSRRARRSAGRRKSAAIAPLAGQGRGIAVRITLS